MSFGFVFPGQGSQGLKMLDGLAEFSLLQDTFTVASQTLNVDFLTMLQEETADNINQTINTQPLMLAADVATYAIWRDLGGSTPTYIAGHSLGEWSALVVSGVVKFTDALRLVRLRAELMQDAVPHGVGAMAAVIGLDDAAIIDACNQIMHANGGVVQGVNFNAPGQVVIAGNKDMVELASVLLKERGARKVQMLPVSVPSHCTLMKGASELFRAELEKIEFNSPIIPVIHNYNAEICADVEAIKNALVEQLYSPVLWSKSIVNMVQMLGVPANIVECGPGKVLSGLNKRIVEGVTSFNLHNHADFEKALESI